MSELQDTFAEVVQAARNLGKIDSGLEHEMTIYRDTYYGLLDRLQEAHDRELSEARNPSHACMCKNKREHERELELLREYGRGRRDGIELADYQRGKVARRLRAVDFDQCEGSHAMLNAVCSAIHAPENGGWTRGQVCELRDALVDLLGRKTSELERERAEVVANLREFNSEEIEPWFEMQFWCLLAHLGIDKSAGESSSCNDITHVRDRLIHLLGGDPIYEKPRKATIGDAETESNLWDSPKTINKTITTERDKLRDRLNELDQSGATNLYKLLKHTLGEAKQLADSLRASKDTRASLMEDVREKAAEVESLRVECRMYRTVLNDAVKEYTDVAADRDAYMDACKDERPDSYDAIARDLINGTCTRCEGVQRMEAMNG